MFQQAHRNIVHIRMASPLSYHRNCPPENSVDTTTATIMGSSGIPCYFKCIQPWVWSTLTMSELLHTNYPNLLYDFE